MSKPQKPKKVREKSKTRAWEKERRDRINDYFNKLWQVLPIYDSSKPIISKPDILINAVSTIKDLNEKLDNLLGSSDSEKLPEEKLKVSSEVIKKLQVRVKKLLLRNEQLAGLLNKAGIKVPAECGTVKKLRKAHKYTNAISPEQKADILQKELEKENQVKVSRPRAPKSGVKRKRVLTKSKDKKSKKQLVSPSSCLLLVSQPAVSNNGYCFILSKASPKINQTVLTNSLLVKAPILSSDIKAASYPQLPSLDQGSLVLVNGTAMPVVPAPRPLPIAPTILTNPPQLSTLIVVSSKNSLPPVSLDTKSSKSFAILPTVPSAVNSLPILKLRTSITKTTQVNKVPIPALSSKYYKHACLGNKKAEQQGKKDPSASVNASVSQNPVKKRAQRTESSQNETKKLKSAPKVSEPNNISTSANEGQAARPSGDSQSNPTTGKSVVTSANGASVEKATGNQPEILHSTISSNEEVSKEENLKLSNDASTTSKASLVEKLTEPINATDAPAAKPPQAAAELPSNVTSSSPQGSTVTKHPEISSSSSLTTDTAKNFELNIAKEFVLHHPETSSSSQVNPSVPTTTAKSQSSNINDFKSLEMGLPQTELSNDIFASFQVPPGCQNPESTSPTAAFLLAFPLVSSGVKVAEVMGDDNADPVGTPNLLQIGTMDIAKPVQSYAESLTPNIFDNSFSFFNNKEYCGGFYNNYNGVASVGTSKMATSFAGVDAVSREIRHGQPKPSEGHKFSYGGQAACHNNNKVDISSAGHVNYGVTGKESAVADTLRNVEKIGASSLMHVNSSVLDMNNDIFPFKNAVNENYSNNNKDMSQIIATTSKSSNSFPDYSTSSAANQFVANKYYPPVYTSAGVNNTYYNAFRTNNNNNNNNNRHFSSSNCSNYADYNKNSCNGNNPHQMYQKEKVQPKIKQPPPPQNKPINWMTTPSTTASYKPDYFLPPFSKDTCFAPNLAANTSFSTLPANTSSYFNSSVYNPNDHLNIAHQDFRKAPSDVTLPSYNSYQRVAEAEDNNQFSWSPNKMPQFLDTGAHAPPFVSSTLPTLVGDLALNNAPAATNLKGRGSDSNRRKGANCEHPHGPTSTNFFSVSQLVEQSQETVPAKVVSRRSSSGNRSKTNTPKAKRRSEPHKDYHKSEKSNFNLLSLTTNNLFHDGKRSSTKNNPSSYSAEALIGNQGSTEPHSKRTNPSCQNKGVVPSFFNENVVSYFPSLDVAQENSYMHQGYQPNTFQNNGSYISSNNSFMPNSGSQDFLGESNNNLFQSGNAAAAKKPYCKPPDKDDKNLSYSCKKAKKRALNENVLPSFDIHFLSMPGAINSPILPDDFHTTYLPPTTLYSCKNPLYSKSNSEAISGCLIPPLPAISGNKPPALQQHTPVSPSVNSAGTTLTNFNLSTIFPEIKKGPVQETFSDNNRNKGFNPASKTYPIPSSSLQVPFSNKSSIIF